MSFFPCFSHWIPSGRGIISQSLPGEVPLLTCANDLGVVEEQMRSNFFDCSITTNTVTTPDPSLERRGDSFLIFLPCNSLFIKQLLFLVLLTGLLLAGCRKEQTVELEIVSISDDEAIEADRISREQIPVTLHDGIEMRLWASESLVQDPVALHADAAGRIFITTTNRRRNAELDIRRYRPWFIESLMLETVEDRIRFIEQEFPSYRPGDVSGQKLENLTGFPEEVFILEDTSGNGFANRSTLFIRDFDEPVTDVAGTVLTFGDDVYVGVSPDLWRIRDTTGDGYGDQKESISHGFGVNLGFAGHGMSGLVTGPDGRIYWSIGDVGMSVTDQDGKIWHYPRQGVIVRSEPDGSNFEVFAVGLRNTHEFDFDKYGNLISVDNDGDHPGEFERLVYLVDGSDSGWRLNWQFGKYDDPKNNSYKVLMDEEYYKPRFEGQAAHILPPLARYRTGPAGMVYNPGTALSSEWNDYFFVAQFSGAASRSGINAFRLRPSGASFELDSDKEVMRGILATGLDFGTDGGLYAADWIEGWELKQEGRIWRLDTSPGISDSNLRMDTQQRLAEDFSSYSSDNLAGLLKHADMRVRKKTQFELAARNDREMLLNAVHDSDHQLARIHGLWGLAQIARRTPDAAESIIFFLNDPDDEIRAQTAKMLGDVRYTPAADAIIPLLRDENLRVRFFAMEALGRMAWRPAFDAIVNLLAENNDEDVYLRHGGAIALQRMDDESAVAELAGHPSKAVRIAAVAALMRMESPEAALFLQDEDEFIVTSAARAINDDRLIKEAVPALAALLDETRFMNEPLIRRIINANLYEGSRQSAARLAMFAASTDVPEVLRIEALQTLEVWAEPSVLDRVTGDPRGTIYNNAEYAQQALEPVFANILTQPSEDLFIAALNAVSGLHAESTITKILTLLSESDSHQVRISSLNTLAALNYHLIEEAVFEALRDEVADVRMNALSLIPHLDLPRETAVSLISPIFDNGTVTELRTAINTLADIDHPSAREMLSRHLGLLIRDELNPELQLDLVLAAERTSFTELHQLLETYEASKAPDDSVSVYRETLYGGDANRGRNLFFRDVGAQCINCHVVDGEGAEIGPDLSRVAERLSREQFLKAMVSPTEHPVSGYTILTITTQDGNQYRGVFQRETDDYIILTIDGEPVEISKEHISERRHSPSAMPAMGEVLSRSQLRDIIEYLSTLRAQ